MNEVPPLYPPAAREHWVAEHPEMDVVEVPDVNHYSIVVSREGAAALAPHVRAAIG